MFAETWDQSEPGRAGTHPTVPRLSPVTPVVAGVGWPEPPEKVSRVSVSQCWLRPRSRQTPWLRECEDARQHELSRSDWLRPDVPWNISRQDERDSQSDRSSSWRHGGLMEERPKIVKICGTFENSSDSSALSYMTVRWEVGGSNRRQANYHQLPPPALLQWLLSFLARLAGCYTTNSVNFISVAVSYL